MGGRELWLPRARLPERGLGTNNYWYFGQVARHRASAETNTQVDQLVQALFLGAEASGESAADIARRADLNPETVRRIWRNPGSRSRSGPSFLIVAAIAKARDISLDDLAVASGRATAGVGASADPGTQSDGGKP